MATQDNSEEKFPGYPQYPASKDIYNNAQKEEGIDPNDKSKLKTENEKENLPNEKRFKDDVSGSDLDVPGSELDDADELTGNEDEENNYYSIGGDNHENLEEDNNQ